MNTVRFMWKVLQMYRSASKRGVSFYSLTHYRTGVPETTIILARGREAWRVSDLATDYFARRGVNVPE
jgi:hypothetical protein